MYEKLETLLKKYEAKHGEFVSELNDYDHYAMKYVPKDCEYISYRKNDKHPLPFAVIYHDGYQEVFKNTPYGIRRNILNDMRDSGLANIQEDKDYSFDSYIATEEWQKHFKSLAQNYVQNFNKKDWFYVSGETGAGKSHLCTSIVFGLASKGIGARYISYPQFLSRMRNNIESAGDMLESVKRAEVLYIDDFLKSVGNSGNVTDFEGRQIIDLMWHRYNNSLPTIISTELKLSQVEEIDKALRGRVTEMAKGYVLQAHGEDKDYRLKQFKEQ